MDCKENITDKSYIKLKRAERNDPIYKDMAIIKGHNNMEYFDLLDLLSYAKTDKPVDKTMIRLKGLCRIYEHGMKTIPVTIYIDTNSDGDTYYTCERVYDAFNVVCRSDAGDKPHNERVTFTTYGTNAQEALDKNNALIDVVLNYEKY